ncbi:hypothetical protein [uncultured Psychroserpens sp.]|uniref:hypothetical protein n=1 Tax=uncultured Psychroserpens sp. TaxID=255436 RepID=UPI0026081792|nr:hypothetical protein [uncultured Psychroserpens sp.]
MLSTEKQEVIQGCIIYQDYTDPNNFYCLPEEKAKIADNGRAVQYVVYTDDEIIEGDDPNFDNDESRVGGFLTLQVELGPTEEKFESIKDELKSKYGDGVNLSMVPFKDGDVKLVVFSSDGSQEANTEDFKVTIAGSTKPSLGLRQTAVFSTRLSNKPAQIMWNLLKQEGQTQVAVVYDLSYLGVMKAYNLEITVDFKATEDFWNHSFNLRAGVKNDNINIAASADIDVMIRELMSDGAITVKQVVYAEGESETNLLGNDPTGIELVKKLMGPTLFQATAIPTEDYSSAINETIANRVRDEEEDADGEDEDHDDPPLHNEEEDEDGGNGEESGEEEEDMEDDETDEEAGEETDEEGSGEDDDTTEGNGEESVDGTNSDNDRPEGEAETGEGEDSGGDNETGGDTDPPDNSVTVPSEDETPNGGESGGESGEDENPEEEETSSALDVDINVGYTLRRREISQQIKRKFTFDKAEAKVIKYHPNGALTLAGTAFDADKQLMITRLNEGPFKEIELEVRASFDFEEYDVREAIVHISYGYKGNKGDKSQRVHEHSITLDQNNLSDKIKFFVDDHGTLSYDYQVEFIHNTGSIIGSPETKITSQLFEDETDRALSINMDTHSPLIPVEIQAGELQFSDDGIRSVQVFLAPSKSANGRTTILNSANAEMKRYLIHPPEENQYDYYLKQEFFFKDEKLVFEEENIKDSQVVVDRPFARIFNITPNLASSNNLVRQTLVDIKYTTADSEEKETTLSLTPEIPTKSFAVLVEESDPRQWRGRSRFILNDGRLLEGNWINYDTEQPFINLDNSGFRTLKVATLLGQATFAGRLAAIEINLSSTDPSHPGNTVLFLNSSKVEDIAIIPDLPVTVALTAAVRIFAKDGSQEEQSYAIPPNTPQLMLPITTVN